MSGVSMLNFRVSAMFGTRNSAFSPAMWSKLASNDSIRFSVTPLLDNKRFSSGFVRTGGSGDCLASSIISFKLS